MKKTLISTISLLALVAAAFTSCNKEEGSGEPAVCPVDSTTKVVIDGLQKMTYPLFAEINAKAKQDENFMVSPLSLSEVLMMLANGAGGKTRSQMMETMQMQGLNPEAASQSFRDINYYLTHAEKNTTVRIANSLWIDKGIKVSSDYVNNNVAWFDAETRIQELGTSKTMNDINDWCKDKTKGCINKILDQPLSSDCRMALMNALYFKGIWANKFEKGNTKDEPFHNIDGTTSTVKMMHQTEEFDAWVGEKYDVASFPYKNGYYCMDVILPHEGESLNDCLQSLDKETMDSIKNEMYRRNIELSMPRWEMKYGSDLVGTLQKMGMVDAFDPNAADFTNISSTPLFLGLLKQATYIKVDEEGTEAAAVTIGGMYETALPPSEHLVFDMNRPFAYIIREKWSGTILFIGRVVKM